MKIPLTDATNDRLARLFSVDDLDAAKTLLEQDCGQNITKPPTLIERVRFAVLKISGGTLEGLIDAIVLAQTDWRDALVSAGFADNPGQHKAWWPNNQKLC